MRYRPLWMSAILLMCAAERMGLAMDATQISDMVYIPAGEFVMGATAEEAARLAAEYQVHPSLFAFECPQRKVNIPAFYIDRYPVTNAQYKKFVDAAGHRPPLGWRNRTFPDGKADYPVVNVDWKDADAYARWAGKRLPTEEEWEKAARGADGRTYPWGNEWNDRACLMDDGKSPQVPGTIPVGCFPEGAGPYGVYDLVGNVAQWTATEASAPDLKKNWAWYVIKGAGRAHQMRFNFRCAAKAFSAHQSRLHEWLGFRGALSAPEPPPADWKSEPRPPASLPAAPPPSGPNAAAFGREPIKIVVGKTNPSASFQVPYFPEGSFGFSIPEQAGVRDFPFAWSERPPFEWKTDDKGTYAHYECNFQNKAVMSVTLKSGADFVDFTIAIRNLTGETFKTPSSNSCFNNRSPYFLDPERARTMVWTDDGPVRLLDMPVANRGEILHNGWAVAAPDEKAPKGGNFVRLPLIFLCSRDGQWVIAEAYGEGVTVASNAHYSCLHTRPFWPDIPPGEERSVTGKLYWLKGGPQDLLTRWKKDFAKP